MKATTSTSIDLHFNIHDYKERLTPSKKGKFHCPVCNDPNFSIDKKGPGYACYKGGCEAKDIQEAIRPAAEVKQLLEADRERKRKTPVPYSLSAAHLKEMALSGIPEGLARMSIRSVDDAHQIAEFLDWKGYMGSIGWLYTGVDPETGFDTGIGQFKPDEQFAFPNGNLAKYLSQKHAYDAACLRVPCWVMRKVSSRYGVPMPDGMAVINDSDDVTPVFWRWVIDNPQLPISPAEGVKKALLLLAEGRIGISISGVDMATIGRGVDLVPSLKKLAVKGRPVEPFYDADIIEKPDVENALMAFGAALTRAGCVITVPTWDLKLGKGVDDLAVNEGETWESCLTVLSYKDWLKKLEQQRQESKKRSPVKKSKDTVDSLKQNSEQPSEEELDRIHEENLKYGDDPERKVEFNQQALGFLFGDKPWICADGKLYYWTGNHYKYSPDSEQRPRIASYCNSFPVFKEKKGLTFPFANPASANQVLEWAKMRLEINSDLLNPPGLNCTNGVLQLHWDTTAVRLAPMPRWELIEHTPDLYYTYQPIATYNPEAVTEHCDRLMEVLSAPQQDIFLKTIAASLDLETVRKYKGRMVRALLLKGYGSNGKDTLREIVSLMFGRIGMTAATLSDFAAYDEGRKFPLARTASSRVNWASENAQTARLDKIQSLKAFITGDTLSREGKGKDEEDFIPKAIAVFNCNDTPNMQGSLEAIKSRYGVLSFDKTFKVKADPTRGEIEADPRFKYDPDFLKAEVLPAFLNKVLDALVALMADGIDYTATEAAMAAIQAENSHLFQFSQDTGLNYSPDDSLTASDIWTRLETWYQDNGTLVYETASNDKLKAVWFDQPKRGDYNVKGANQVLARIQALFPKATRTTIYSATAKKSVPALTGIGFVATRPSSDPVPTQYPPQETVTQQDFRPTRPSFSDFEQNQKILEEVEAETEADLENLADNFVSETVEPVKTGAGGSESLDIKVSWGGTGAETGSGGIETGSGGVEKTIALPEPETTPTAQTAPPTAPTAQPITPPEPETAPTAQTVAPPEPETAPTAPTVPTPPTVAPIADELPLPTIIKNIREAITNIDQAAAKITWQKIKNSATQKEAVKADLEPDENLNFRLLLNTGWLKGTQVRYTGTKFAEQYAGIELTVEDLRDRNGITCRKPDGSYTADLDKEDLEKLEQPEVIEDAE
ncbi:DUF3854 domain-containing protein [Microcoleus sp. B7-D4]|uniref:DUF3854 domain-containing protein n=1 Tax=Microcoleus sp. B7-D4 TaxID=2818696 RepID=UPI002FD023F4